MTLSDLAAIGSLVSGVAVLVSLVYLALQVRQTEKNQRALINQGATTQSRDAIRAFAEPHMAALLSRVVAGERDFTAPELVRMSMVLRLTLIGMQDTLFQHHEGLIDEGTLENIFRASGSLLAHPVFRALRLEGRETYVPEFASRVDKLIGDRSVAKPVDALTRFQANLAKVIGS